MKFPDEYTETVFEFLDQAKPEQTFVIEKITKASTRAQFIEAVKLYIQYYPFGGGVVFNKDYTKIHKFEIPEEALKAFFEYHRIQQA
jgi:hypothetical protein